MVRFECLLFNTRVVFLKFAESAAATAARARTIQADGGCQDGAGGAKGIEGDRRHSVK